MAQKTINLGTADKGNGDPLRTAFDKVNDNFAELYANLVTFLPNPSGNDGKFLTTDGVDLLWNTVAIPTDVNQLADVNGLLGSTITSVGATPPGTPDLGTLWYDTVSGRIYVYYDASWIDASPKGVASSIMSGTKASNATGTVGQISYDTNWIYICTATNTWKRSPLTGGY
jgi:hypothetical protein